MEIGSWRLDRIKDDDKENGFNIDNCYIIKRTQRNKGKMTRKNNVRKKVFFAENIDDDNKDIVMQQMLDSLHTFLYHTSRIQYKKYIRPQSKPDAE